MIQTKSNQIEVFGYTPAASSPDFLSSLEKALKAMFYSYHDVAWCREIVDSLKNTEEVFCFLEDFNDIVPSFSHIEVDFTNYNEIAKLKTENRLSRIQDWVKHFGALNRDEIEGYCTAFELDLNQALSRNKEADYKLKTSPPKIFDVLSKDVIGQEGAKKALAVELFNHSLRLQQSLSFNASKTIFPKSNILLVGPSGSGKTLLARKSAAILDVPFIKIDAASSVKSGIVGSSLTDSFQSYYSTMGDKDRLEYAIVLIDEFDKLATNYAYDRTAIQNELLNIIGENGAVSFEPSRNQPKITLDCSKMLFIFCGAFQDLTSEKSNNPKIGFNRGLQQLQTRAKKLNKSAIQRFGFSAEIMNRLHKVLHLKKLSEKDIVDLLRNSESSPVLPYKNLFKEFGKEIDFSDSFYTALAKKVRKTEQNGRGPASILSNVMEDIIYSITSTGDRILIDETYL